MTIEALNVLVGKWELTGRTPDAAADDVSGDLIAEPILDGNVLQLWGTTRVGTFEAHSLELIWFDTDTGFFRSHVYSNGGAPLDYSWAIDGSTLEHSTIGATYTGTISADGNTIAGGWRADPGHPETAGSNYDATMRRIG